MVKSPRLKMTNWQVWMACGLLMFLPAAAPADIYRWDNGQLIPGTEGITPGPGVYLSSLSTPLRNLRFADFSGGLDLTQANFSSSWLDDSRFNGANLTNASLQFATVTNADLSGTSLTNAELAGATLTNANLSGAVVTGAQFVNATSRGFTKEQLYSTASYQQRDSNGINLSGNDLTGWDFSGQNLTGAGFVDSTLTSANFAAAVIATANFARFGGVGIALPQLYSTASYQQRNLRGIVFQGNDLTGGDFSGQDLTDAELYNANVSDANLSGAVVVGAGFSYTPGFTKEQLYSTASYQQRSLRSFRLIGNDLTGWDFSGQDLTDANLSHAILTNANLAGAIVTGASFGRDTWGSTPQRLTKEQLYSTASYQQRDLNEINLTNNDLADWDFSGQNLTGAVFDSSTLTNADLSGTNLTFADLRGATLTNADLSGTNLTNASLASYFPDLLGVTTLTNANLAGAIVTGASFERTRGFTSQQLYSTASYQQRDLYGISLSGNNLTGWDFSGQDLTGAYFISSRLANADFSGTNLTNAQLGSVYAEDADATLTNANFAGAIVTGAAFYGTPSFTREQLYSTASYQQRDLRGIKLAFNSLIGWDFSGQDLTGAELSGANLTSADLSGAVVTGAQFVNITSRGFTKDQLYSTASYQQRNLRGIQLHHNDLTGWDFSGQDLSGAFLSNSQLTNADLSGAVVAGALFRNTTSGAVTKEQLYSTASYQQRNLRGIDLESNDLTGWDFSGQDLAGANFSHSQLTNANFSFADLRRAAMAIAPLLARNTIRESGAINGLDLAAGETLVVRDSDIGIMVNDSMNAVSGGTLELVLNDADWGSTMSVAAGMTPKLGGTLRVRFAEQADLASMLGTTFDFFDWATVLDSNNRFDAIELPSGTQWDLNQLYVTGTATVTAIPEPSAVLLLVWGTAAWILVWRFASGGRRARRAGATAFGPLKIVRANSPGRQPVRR